MEFTMTALEGARLLKARAMQKKAYVPLTPAAQEAMAAQQQGAPMDPAMAQGGMPPMPMDPSMQQGMPMDPSMMGGAPVDPSMTQGGGMPPMPMEPNMMAQGGMPPQGAGMPPQQGAQQPIQIVPGPVDPSTGQPIPIDAETGMIVLDPANGVEMDMNTGIVFMKFTNEFYTNDGQPLDPNQAMQMIVEAAAGPVDPNQQQQDMAQIQQMQAQSDAMMGQGMPPQGGGMGMSPEQGMPMDPSMMGGAPMDPNAMAQGGMPPMAMDPYMMGGAPANPAVTPVADPATMSQQAVPTDPNAVTQQAAPVDPAAAGMPMFDNTADIQGTLAQLMQMQEDQARIQSEQQADIDAANKLSDNTNKVVKKLMDSTNALRREISAYHDNNERLAAEIESLLDAIGVGLNSANRNVR